MRFLKTLSKELYCDYSTFCKHICISCSKKHNCIVDVKGSNIPENG